MVGDERWGNPSVDERVLSRIAKRNDQSRSLATGANCLNYRRVYRRGRKSGNCDRPHSRSFAASSDWESIASVLLGVFYFNWQWIKVVGKVEDLETLCFKNRNERVETSDRPLKSI